MEREFEEGTAEAWDGDPERDRAPAEADRAPKWVETATPAAPSGDRARRRALPPSEHYAAHLHETSGSAYLYCSMSQVFREVVPDAFKVYLLRVLEGAGNPSDPIERMLVEQVCLAHHNIGRLHVKAASAQTLDETRTYVGAAALLTGEFRRCVLALKSYRTSDKLQAVAVGVVQSPSDARTDEAAKPSREEGPDGEQGNTSGAGDHGEETIPFREPEAGGGREAERSQEKRIHAGGP